MTFPERASRSVNNLRILFDLDITQLHSQWVNAGAGVWYFNNLGLYPEVDSSLLSGFTAIAAPAVGSVNIDDTELAQVYTILECSDNMETFFWDGERLYIHIYGHDSPYIHTINIGVVNGYSQQGFTPVNCPTFYESRLIGIPSISKSRDPLYYGKLQYEGGSAELNNGDGHLDMLGESNNLYGNSVRVKLGFEDEDYTEYERIFSGYVNTVGLTETSVNIGFKDRRKKLSQKITYTCTNLNALEAIEEILLDTYGIKYTSALFDTTAWEDAKTQVANITMAMADEKDTIDVIQNICESVFGLFLITQDGLYSFKVIRPDNLCLSEIMEEDIMNRIELEYDPSEVITSTKIGYAKDWTTSGTAYTYLTDTSQEAAIYAKYRVYNQKTFDTLLIDLAAAQSFSDTILDYVGTIRPSCKLVLPIKYYALDIGDFCYVTVNRPNSTWLGIQNCEITRKEYDVQNNSITFQARLYPYEDYPIAWWSLDAVPEIPDAPAGVTYNSNFATVDGWATMGVDTVVTVAASQLVLTKGATPTTFVRANKALVVSSKTVRVRWACAQTDLTTLEIGTSGAGTHVTKSIAGTTSGIVDITTGATFTDFELIFNSTGVNTQPVYVTFIYVGTGAYVAGSLADDSGNGNAGTIFGATPVDGVSGKALSFDGVNDYVRTATIPIPDIMTYNVWLNINVSASLNQYIFGTSDSHLTMRRPSSSANSIRLGTWNGTSVVGVGANSFFSGYDNVNVMATGIVNYTAGTVLIYRNAVLIETTTGLTLVKPADSYIDIGITLLGTIDEPRIYNRALSSAEVKRLYQGWYF